MPSIRWRLQHLFGLKSFPLKYLRDGRAYRQEYSLLLIETEIHILKNVGQISPFLPNAASKTNFTKATLGLIPATEIDFSLKNLGSERKITY